MESTKKAAVIRPRIEENRRVIAISDIHGNLPFLKKLLEKVGFCKEDVLVLVGDLLEKGDESLAVLRYVMELAKEYEVYALCGNCDQIDCEFLRGGPGVDELLWKVYWFWGKRSLMIQMGEELGIELKTIEDMPRLRQAVLERFPEETSFLLSMPHIMEVGNYIFVHGGIPHEDHLEDLDAHSCMKNDDFLGQGLSFNKWVVVGHWPVTLYDGHIASAAPIIDRRRHIVSIDGGCVLKVDGQLNALLIPNVYGDEMTCKSFDNLPVVVALEPQRASEESLNIRWSDSAVEVLREEGDCCWCRHVSTGREMWILKEYIYRRKSDGLMHCEDSTDYRLPVDAGDRLALVRKCSRGCLVKKHGVTGWYFGPVQEIKKEKTS